MARILIGNIKGPAFKYEDFTPEQLEALKGEPGVTDYGDLKNRPVIPASVSAVEHQYAVGTSEDRISEVETWTKVTASLSQRERSCIFANGYYVVCGVGGEVGISKDGVSWTKLPAFVSGTLTNIAYGKGKFIIVDEFSGLWMAEETPEAWRQVVSGDFWSGDIGSLTYANNQFVIAGENMAAFSEDGIGWTIVEAPGDYNQITFGNGRYVAVGANGSVGVSYDGKTWADRSNPAVTGDLRAITYAKGKYIIGGIDGLIMHTEDFETWGIATSNSAGVRYVRQITYAENRYYAACYTSSGKGEIWVSEDGETWTVQQQMNVRLWCLNYNDGKLTAAGDSGAVFILDLGIDWQPKRADLSEGQYLWERILFTLSDGGAIVSDGVCIARASGGSPNGNANPVVLYDNESGTTGTVELSESAANFSYLEVFAYSGSSKRSASVKVAAPDGKIATLFIPWGGDSSNWEYRGGWAISGTTMTCSLNHTYNPGTSATASTAKNEMYVCKVVGYR